MSPELEAFVKQHAKQIILVLVVYECLILLFRLRIRLRAGAILVQSHTLRGC